MPGNFKCPRCKELFRDNNDLKRHLERKKPCYSKDQPPESPEWSCGPCKSSFTTKGHYETHLKSQVHARMTNEAIDHMPLEEAVEESPSQDAAGPSNRSDEPGQAQAIEFVLPTLDTSKIRKTSENPPRVAVFDLIAVITGLNANNSAMTYSRLISSHPEIQSISSSHKFKGRGQKMVPVIQFTVANVNNILKAIVPGMKIPLAKKRALLCLQEPLHKYTEVEIHSRIRRALGRFSSIPQYQVGKYRLDLFFPCEKLAVECDENNHVGYDQAKEKERYDTITARLGCTWIRYDPYDRKFDIFDLINQILQNLMISYTIRI